MRSTFRRTGIGRTKMLKAKLGRTLLGTFCIAAILSIGIAACNTGGTSNDGSADAADTPSGQYISDGGAGGSLTIRISGSLTVGGTTGFTVTALDAAGAPLAFIRIFCESERGIAIIEPSSGGTSFESTGPNGLMSGRLGGLTPGSYIMECRGPEGFNLVARTQITISGSIPEGFQGFPGAAGGNLGGGFLVDQTPDPDGTVGVRVTGISIFDSGSTSSSDSQIDLTQTSDCDGDTETVDPEPVFFTNFSLAISNGSAARAFVDTVTITVASPTALTSLISLVACEIPPLSSATCSGPFAEFQGTATSGNPIAKSLIGTSTSLAAGTFNTTFAIAGTDEDGGTFTDSAGLALVYGSVNRCP